MTDAANRERPRPPSVRSRVRQPSAGASIVPAKPAPPLSPSAQALAGAALAPATVRAYRGALDALDRWLAEQGRAADDAGIADYLAARHDAGAAPASIGMTVAAVKAAARLSGRPSPAGPETARVMAGIRREGRGRGRGQATGLQWAAADTVAAVAANAGRRSLAGLRDAALVALASDALLRVSEVVAVQVADIAAEPDGSGRLTVHRSKTDQEGRGVVLYLGEPTMRRIAAWREASGIHEGPLFRRLRRGDRVEASAISDRAARSVIRARAADAGIEGRVSGHSLRIGAAQSLAAAGAGLVELQQAGRWGSPAMPAHYARGQLAARGAVARLRHGQSKVGR